MKILLVACDKAFGEAITQALRQAGHEVELMAEPQGDRPAGLRGFDLSVVVQTLAGMDGPAPIQVLHGAKAGTPLLVLVLPAEFESRTGDAHANGADPGLPALVARLPVWVDALARQTTHHRSEPASLRVDDLEMDRLGHSVFRHGRPIALTPREFKLLEYLMRHPGKLVTRAMLLEHVWGLYDDSETSIVETEISRLRHKIDQDFEQKLLHTVRGSGYRLGAAVAGRARDR